MYFPKVVKMRDSLRKDSEKDFFEMSLYSERKTMK